MTCDTTGKSQVHGAERSETGKTTYCRISYLYDILETANLQGTEVGEFSVPQVLPEIMKGQEKPWSGLSVI